MKIVTYSNEYETAWNSFNRTAKNGLFLFDRGFMEYHSDRFTDHSLIVFDDKDKIIALLPANLSGKRLYSHQGLTFGGFITDAAMKAPMMLAVFDLLKEYLRQNGIASLMYKAIPHIYHRYPAQEDLYALFRNNAVQVRVDASTCLPFINPLPFSKGKRWGAGKAKKSGVAVRASTNYAEFMDLLAITLKMRHDAAPTHTSDEIFLLASRFPDNIRLFAAFREAEMIAGTILFVYDTVVHTQYIENSDAGREICALDLVIEHVIVHYQNSGHAYFDFGISNEQQGTILNEGLVSQKEMFGARTVTHHFYEMTVG